MKNYTPKELVELLDKVIIGQEEAKLSVAIAFRDRHRRTLLDKKDKSWVPVRNILLKGPSGTSKTEMARMIASICDFPFIKIDATSLTSRGYVGGKVSTYLKKMLNQSEHLYQKTLKDFQNSQVSEEVEVVVDAKKLIGYISVICDSVLKSYKPADRKKIKPTVDKFKDATINYIKTGNFEIKGPFEVELTNNMRRSTIIKVCSSLSHSFKEEDGKYNLSTVYRLLGLLDAFGESSGMFNILDFEVGSAVYEIDGLFTKVVLGLGNPYDFKEYKDMKNIKFDSTFTKPSSDIDLIEMFPELFGKKDKPVTVTYSNSLMDLPLKERLDLAKHGKSLIANNQSRKRNVPLPPELKSCQAFVENYGVVFIDEIDKLIPTKGNNSHASTEVQFELLRLIEGTDFNLKDDDRGFSVGGDSSLNTSNILFICAGAFVNTGESGLISELRGRLPVEVNLHPLNQDHLYRIMTESEKSPLMALVKTHAVDNITLDWTEDGLRRIAQITHSMNQADEDLGARRLTTVLSIVLKYLTVMRGNVDGKVTLDLSSVEEAYQGFLDDNKHLYDWSNKKYPLSTWSSMLKDKSRSPIFYEILFRLSKGKVRSITYPEYELLAAVLYMVTTLDHPNKSKFLSDLMDVILTPKKNGLIPEWFDYIKEKFIAGVPELLPPKYNGKFVASGDMPAAISLIESYFDVEK